MTISKNLIYDAKLFHSFEIFIYEYAFNEKTLLIDHEK